MGSRVLNSASPMLFCIDHARFCRWVVFRGVPGINNVIIGAVPALCPRCAKTPPRGRAWWELCPRATVDLCPTGACSASVLGPPCAPKAKFPSFGIQAVCLALSPLPLVGWGGDGVGLNERLASEVHRLPVASMSTSFGRHVLWAARSVFMSHWPVVVVCLGALCVPVSAGACLHERVVGMCLMVSDVCCGVHIAALWARG